MPHATRPLRLQRLDALRLAAVLLVIANHLSPVLPADGDGLPLRLARAIVRGGWVGVDLFFVLSGFLVAGLLFDEQKRAGRVSALTFLVRRGWKIYPPFWGLLAVSVIAAATFDRQPQLLAKTVSELVFVQNYGPALWNHTWSLAVEEHFYLLLAMAFAAFAHRRGALARVPRCFALVAVACLGLRIATAIALPYAHKTHLFPTHLRLDSLAAGAMLAYGYHHHRERFLTMARAHRLALWLTAALAFLPAFVFTRETTPLLYTVGFSSLWLGAACVVAVLVGGETQAPSPGLAIAGYLGARSYSIYLWHMPVLLWIGPRLLVRISARGLALPWMASVAIDVLAALLVGVVMAQLVELPFLRLRDRWALRDSRSQDPS